jgi:hypothetical protein
MGELKKILILGFSLFASAAFAQTGTPVKQSGMITPGHVPMWTTDGVIQDGGTAAIAYPSSFGTTGQGPTICANSAPQSSGAWQQICIGAVTATGGTISLQNYGTAPVGGLNLLINGTSYSFPFVPAQFVGPGVDANILNTQTSNYTVALSDCGKTIELGTGSTGLFTLTLPVVAGFSSNCSVLIKNADTTRGKIMSGFPTDIASILWPQQSVGVKIVNGAWESFYQPGRWRPTSTAELYVDPVNGNDANDGLATLTGAFRTIQGALSTVAADFDFSNLGSGAVINCVGTFSNNTGINVSAPWVGSVGEYPVTIDGGGTAIVSESGNASTFSVFGGGYLTVQNFAGLSYSGSGGNIFESHFHGNLAVAGSVTMTGSTGGGVYVSDDSYFSVAGTTLSLTGNYAGDLFGLTNGSLGLFESTSIQIAGNITDAVFISVGNNSTADWHGATIATNGHSVTGIRASVGQGGVLQTPLGTANLTAFPGNSTPAFFGVSSYDTTFPGLIGWRSQYVPSNPTGTASTAAFVMMGLANGFTPTTTGALVLQVSGYFSNSSSGDGCATEIRFGTGSAPGNGAALTGSLLGSFVLGTSEGNGATLPFSHVGYVSGLTLNTTYWWDIAAEAQTGGTCTPSNISMVAIEE